MEDEPRCNIFKIFLLPEYFPNKSMESWSNTIKILFYAHCFHIVRLHLNSNVAADMLQLLFIVCVCVRAQFACFNDCTSAHAEEQRRVRVFLEITRSVSTGGDQGVLNSFFNTWATTDISKHLPFIYNLSTVSIYSYLPAFKQSVHTFEQICSDTFVLRG